jgi:hypothetical protein
MGYGNVAPAPVRSTEPLEELVDAAVLLFAPSFEQATAKAIGRMSLRAFTSLLVLVWPGNGQK